MLLHPSCAYVGLFICNVVYKVDGYFANKHTLYCICLPSCCFGPKTRVVIKMSTHLATQETLTDFHGDEAKKYQNDCRKKTEFFNFANSQDFFQTFLGLVGLIDAKEIDLAQPVWL